MTCGTQIARGLLVCPACGALVFAGRLRQLASEAEGSAAIGNASRALELWREALTLLPPQTRQHEAIVGKIEQLSRHVESVGFSTADRVSDVSPLSQAPDPRVSASRPTWRETEPAKKKSRGAIWAVLATVGLLAWKFKAVLAFILTKGKFLLLGLTKSSTFFSMFLSMGAYWALFGWKFAVGLVVSIYIHEMGHVFALNRYGIKATPPMFIPGLGAMIRLKQYPTLPREEAIVGLGGPLWGLGAAIGAYLVYLATGWAAWGAIAQVGAWINLFNLLPVWQLDGAHAFKALVRWQRLTVAAMFLAAWVTGSLLERPDGLLVLLALVAAGVALMTRPASKGDNQVLAYFAVLIAALSALTMIHVPRGAL
jgi:Zn-dependent protease